MPYLTLALGMVDSGKFLTIGNGPAQVFHCMLWLDWNVGGLNVDELGNQLR